jgi:hypothetical protein
VLDGDCRSLTFGTDNSEEAFHDDHPYTSRSRNVPNDGTTPVEPGHDGWTMATT